MPDVFHENGSFLSLIFYLLHTQVAGARWLPSTALGVSIGPLYK